MMNIQVGAQIRLQFVFQKEKDIEIDAWSIEDAIEQIFKKLEEHISTFVFDTKLIITKINCNPTFYAFIETRYGRHPIEFETLKLYYTPEPGYNCYLSSGGNKFVNFIPDYEKACVDRTEINDADIAIIKQKLEEINNSAFVKSKVEFRNTSVNEQASQQIKSTIKQLENTFGKNVDILKQARQLFKEEF